MTFQSSTPALSSDDAGWALGEPGALVAPDAVLVRAIYQALMCSGPSASPNRWRETPQGLAIDLRVNVARVTIELEAASAPKAWEIVCRSSPLALDVASLLLAMRAPTVRLAPRLVRAAEVLDAKGCRRWGSERRGLESQLVAELEMLAALRFGPGREPLFPLLPLGGPGSDFVYEPAQWLQRLFSEAPIRLLDRRILDFDHRANRGADVLAKKLAIHLSFSTGARGMAAHTVGALVNALGLTTEEVASRRGRGGRLADRFDEALLRLEECGLFKVRYRGDAHAAEGRTKGWVRDWLRREVTATALGRSPASRDVRAHADHLAGASPDMGEAHTFRSRSASAA